MKGIGSVSNSAKKRDEEQTEKSELGTDREIKLAGNFEDPGLEEILLDVGEPTPPNPTAILHEAADAIQELVSPPAAELEANALDILGVQPAAAGVEPTFDAPDFSKLTSNSLATVMVDESVVDTLDASSRWETAEKLFSLVVCELPFADLVETILKAIIHGMGAEAGSVLEVDHERSEFFFRASVGGGDPEQLKNFRVPQNKGIVGHVAESRQSVLLANLEADEMQLRAISASMGFEARSCIASPIVVGGQLYGVVELFNKHSGGTFNQRDVEQLEELVRMAVKILEVRFLMAELARRAR